MGNDKKNKKFSKNLFILHLLVREKCQRAISEACNFRVLFPLQIEAYRIRLLLQKIGYSSGA